MQVKGNDEIVVSTERSNRNMSDLYVYMICSRNKDNKNVPEFKERCKMILEYRENEDKVIAKFEDFAEKGLPGEKTRLYKSVNSRNEEKIREEFVIRLLRDKPSIIKINSILASVARQTQNRDESKWMFDFDVDNENKVREFINCIHSCSYIPLRYIDMYKTPNGYAIIVPHRFDTRELMEKWKDYDITLKKDGLIFMDMITAGE